MHFIKKSFELLIIAVLTCSFLFAGCGSCGKDDDQKHEDKKDNPSHEEMVETSDYLIKNGVSGYKIVIPDDADSDEFTAAAQLQTLFKEATSCTLQIIEDSSISSISSEDKYILIGDNDFAITNKLVPDQLDVKSTGYTINTKDKCVYIVGGSGVGTLFGVYKFLDYILGYDYFVEGMYSLNKGVTEISLYNYNVKIVPDCEYNQLSYSFLTIAERKNFGMYVPATASVRGRTGHGSIYYTLDDDEDDNIVKAIKNHPKWFKDGIDVSDISEEDAAVNDDALNGVAQLCYTAHGDSVEYEKLYKRMAQNVIDVMISNKDAVKFNCSIMDNHTHCTCDACTAEINKYKTPAGSLVKLLNKVAETVDAWMQTEEGKPYAREWFMVFYAYNDYQDAPVKYVNNNYEFIDGDNSVLCNKRIVPQVCYVGADYTSPIEANVNKSFKLQYDGWRYLSKTVNSYFYEQNYNYYLIPYNVFGVLANQYQYLTGDYVYMLCANDSFATGFGNLKVYLSGKLGINSNANVEELIEKYFKNVYLDASDIMYNLFNEYRTNEQRLKQQYPEDLCVERSCYNRKFLKSSYYESTLFDKWRNDIDSALSKIEYLKTQDVKLYNKVYKMIIGERVWINYFYWQTNHEMMVYDILESVTNDLIHDIEYCGITYTKEGPYVTTNTFISELKTVLEGAKL